LLAITFASFPALRAAPEGGGPGDNTNVNGQPQKSDGLGDNADHGGGIGGVIRHITQRKKSHRTFSRKLTGGKDKIKGQDQPQDQDQEQLKCNIISGPTKFRSGDLTRPPVEPGTYTIQQLLVRRRREEDVATWKPRIAGLTVLLNRLRKLDYANFEGIFRKSGGDDLVKQAFTKVLAGLGNDMANKKPHYGLKSVTDVHVLTGAIKLLLSSAQDRLLDGIVTQTIMDALQGQDNPANLVLIKNAFNTLPEGRKSVIKELFRAFKEVMANEPVNKMSAKALSVAIGNSLVPILKDPIEALIKSTSMMIVLQYMLENVDAVLSW